ncbi:MAG TPA: rRNA maturation RNase YbeY [Coleofasciculaceae cyanobacterium]|jgi:rRNA maturation RNase YbeY
MAEVFASPDYVDTLKTPGLNIEVFAQPQLLPKTPPLLELLTRLSPHFLAIARTEKIFDILELNPEQQALEVELNWVCNDMMRSLNRDYRKKDSATDVLTFPLISDPGSRAPWRHLSAIQLGSIFVSMEWAEAECGQNPELPLERYLLERFVHGMLHLLGQHHDEMPAYQRVVRIQGLVLDATFGA